MQPSVENRWMNVNLSSTMSSNTRKKLEFQPSPLFFSDSILVLCWTLCGLLPHMFTGNFIESKKYNLQRQCSGILQGKKHFFFINRLPIKVILSRLELIAFCFLSHRQGNNNELCITTRQHGDGISCETLFRVVLSGDAMSQWSAVEPHSETVTVLLWSRRHQHERSRPEIVEARPGQEIMCSKTITSHNSILF